MAFGRTWFTFMYAIFGLTTGAIVGLSVTSVTNTLMELIGGLLAGGASVYFLLDVQTDKKRRIEEIGKLGVMFLVCFWAGWLALNQFTSWQENRWKNQENPIILALVLETEAHAKQLGIPEATSSAMINAAIEQLADLSAITTAQCGQNLAQIDEVLLLWRPLIGAVIEGGNMAETEFLREFNDQQLQDVRSKLLAFQADTVTSPAIDRVFTAMSLATAIYAEKARETPVLFALDTLIPDVSFTPVLRQKSRLLNRYFASCLNNPLLDLRNRISEISSEFPLKWGSGPVPRSRGTIVMENVTR